MVLIITLEGGIGVGKTTTYNSLKAAFKDVSGVGFVPEPVDDWQKHGFLKAMYNKEMNAAVFQNLVLMSLYADLMSALNSDTNYEILICERSAATNNLFAIHNLKGIELESYNFIFERLMKAIPKSTTTHHIYLRAPVNTCRDRIRKLNRDGESDIDDSYLAGLHSLHDQWAERSSNVISVDASQSQDSVVLDVISAMQFTIDSCLLPHNAALKPFGDRVMMLRIEAEITSSMLRNMQRFEDHCDRVIVMALMNPSVRTNALPVQVLNVVSQAALKPGQLWTLFKSCGGQTGLVSNAQNPPGQIEALKRVWRALETLLFTRFRESRKLP
jgi:deoxyadenosine/deoxycytidine kinase